MPSRSWNGICPLPEVLARVCDHPCESACIRNSVDQAIAVGDLERACIENRSRQKKYFAPPAKEKKNRHLGPPALPR